MAKAGKKDTSPESDCDRIFLHEALGLAVRALGTEDLAEQQLVEWLGAGDLPWSCRKWKGPDAEDIASFAAGKLPRSETKELDAEDIAKAEQELFGEYTIHTFPSVAYHEGDPRFFRARPQIDCKKNTAWERGVTGGAKASGIRVSRTRLLALLPAGAGGLPLLPADNPSEGSDADDEVRSLKAWVSAAQLAHPKKTGEGISAYARRLYGLMPKRMRSAHVWGTVRRLLYDK
jgi:hypothetical protein